MPPMLLVLGSLFAAFGLVQGEVQPSAPHWGMSDPSYRVRVNMTNPHPVAKWVFDYYFDSTSTPSPSARYVHYPPQYDEVCNGFSKYNASHTCIVVFANDGWSYIEFPRTSIEDRFCCKCENSFGAVRWDWMQKDSSYQGLATVNGLQTQHWVKEGHEGPNNLFVTNDTKQLSVRFSEMWGAKGNKHPKIWDFQLDTFKAGPIDPSFTSAPPQCQSLCQNWCKDYRR